MFIYKKFTSCFSLLALVLSSWASNLSCSANQANEGSGSKILHKSLCLANSKKDPEVKALLSNFLQKVKILAEEKPAVVVVPAAAFLLTLIAAAVTYSLRKKNLQKMSAGSNIEEKNTNIRQDVESDDSGKNDSGAAKSTNNTSSTSSENGAFLKEKAVTKEAPTDEIADENKNINVSEDKSSVTQSSNIEEKIIDTNENVESYDGGKNDSGAAKSTNETGDTSSENGAFLKEKAVTKEAPTDEIADENKNINVSEDKSSVTQSSNMKKKVIDSNENVESYDGGKNDFSAAKSTNDAVDVSSEDSTSKSEYPKYIEIAKWWCFWSVLLPSYCATLSGILTVIFFPGLFSFAILRNIFGFLAPFITFCVDPILNILNVPHSLKMFLEGAIFTFFALIFTLFDFDVLTDFTYKNACLIVKGKDTLLTPWWYYFYNDDVLRKYKKHKEKVDFKQFIDGKYAKLKDEHKNRLIEIYEALNGVESKK